MKIQGGKSLQLEPDKLLWGHFEMRDLAGGEKKRGGRSKKDPESVREGEQDGSPRLQLRVPSFA